MMRFTRFFRPACGATLLLASLAAGPLALSAEPGPSLVAKGGKFVAGSFSFSSAGDSYYQNEAGDRTQEWSVLPGGGRFVADGLALGFHLEGNWFTQGEVRRTAYAMGPVLEYYLDTIGGGDRVGRVLPYAGIGYLWGQARDESPAGRTKHNSGEVSLTAGMAWLLSDQVAADLSANYRNGRFTQKAPLDGVAYASDRWTLFFGFKAFLP